MQNFVGKTKCIAGYMKVANENRVENTAVLESRVSIAKRTKSKNRMQITEFLARLGQHERVRREIQEI